MRHVLDVYKGQYVVSLVPAKGFYLLASSWPAVLAKLPDSQLCVVGAGKLYNRNSVLGKWNIADEKFENKFMKHITNDNQVLPSVHFLGVLGEEKNDLLLKCRVGVQMCIRDSLYHVCYLLL